MKRNDKNSWAVSWGILGAAGMQLAITVVLGIFAGVKADEKWSISPVGLIAGLFFGSAFGFINLLRLLKYRDKIISD